MGGNDKPLNKGMIQKPGETKPDSIKFYEATQNVIQFKSYNLFGNKLENSV